MRKVAKLEQNIRDLVTVPRKRYELRQAQSKSFQFGSSVDAIGDTELAIEHYLDKIEQGASSDGELYIYIYGILQVLYVQSDAVQHLCEALNVDYKRSDTITRIRRIRNASVGHPTSSNWGKAFNFIIRGSMRRSSFSLITYSSNGDTTISDVDILELINEQEEALVPVLNNIIEILEKDEMEHREKYRHKKLVDLFLNENYSFKIMDEAISTEAPDGYGMLAVKGIDSILSKLKEDLMERGIYNAHEVFEEDFKWANYAILNLTHYFEGTGECKLTDDDAHVYSIFLQHHIDSLEKICGEIDRHYESEVISTKYAVEDGVNNNKTQKTDQSELSVDRKSKIDQVLALVWGEEIEQNESLMEIPSELVSTVQELLAKYNASDNTLAENK